MSVLFEHVTAGYGDADILQDLTFTLPAGSVTGSPW